MSGGTLSRIIFKNLHAVMVILVFFEQFLGKFCFNFLSLVLNRPTCFDKYPMSPPKYTPAPSGLNPPRLALLVDLRFSNSIFVCWLMVTENISRGGN